MPVQQGKGEASPSGSPALLCMPFRQPCQNPLPWLGSLCGGAVHPASALALRHQAWSWYNLKRL